MVTTKTWFITGTSSGIGRQLTEQLLARGDRVAATLRDPRAIDDLASRYGDALWTAALDVTDGPHVSAVVDRAFSELGRIDVVVNNAGYGLFGAAEEVTDAQIRRMIDTNLIGAIAVTRAALPHLRAQGGGRVLQISSEGGQIAYPNFSIYHASKWGLEGFTEAVALEVAPFGIEFTIVEPGPTQTNFRSGIDRAPAMDVYAATPSGEMRKAVAEGTFKLTGDPVKSARLIVESVGRQPAPRRLTLGSGPLERIGTALRERLDALEAQADIARAADFDGS